MTIQRHNSRVSKLKTDYPDMNETTIHAIACEYYTAEELLEMKTRLSLDSDEFIETILFIEERGGIDEDKEPLKVNGDDN